MIELWKTIENYSDYQISNFGNIKSNKNGIEKILKPSKSSSGYLQVILCKNGKTKNYFIHKLVAKTFLENDNNYLEINHKDENKLNNYVENLEWCTHKENMNYGNVKQKISKGKSRKIKQLNKEGEILKIYSSIKEAAKENNINETNIVKCCKNKYGYKTCGGYKWEYF